MNRKIAAMHERYGKADGFCQHCEHFMRKKWDVAYRKCAAYGNSNAISTDWCASWRACGLRGKPLPPGHIPVIEQLKHAPRKEPFKPLDGQMRMEEV